MLIDHYAVLGIPPSSTTEEIHKAYLALAKQHHPDTNGAIHAERFKQIAFSYSILKDKAARAKFDGECRLLLSPCLACKGSGVRLAQQGFGSSVKRSCKSCQGSGRAAKGGKA